MRAAQPLRPSPTASTIERPSGSRQSAITSVASVTAGQLEAGKRLQVEIDNRLQSLRRRRIPECIRQRFQPGCVARLECQQFGDRIAPTLRAAATVNRPTHADRGSRLRHSVAQTIDLMSVSGPGDPGREVKARNLPWTAKGGALGTSMSVLTASA